jgi:hypothetical protein
MEHNDYLQRANWLISNGYPVPTDDALKLAEILKNKDIINSRSEEEDVGASPSSKQNATNQGEA